MKPYNTAFRLKKRRQSALDRLEKQIKRLSNTKEGVESSKLDKARECAKNLYLKLGLKQKDE